MKEKDGLDERSRVVNPSDVIRGELRSCVILDRAEAARLAVRWKRYKDFDARERLIRSVLPWAVHLVDRYFKASDSSVSWEDLMSPAMEGLVEGVDHFDPDRGALTTCVSLWVRKRMLSYLCSDYSVVRIPDGMGKRLANVSRKGFQDGDELAICAAKAKWGVLSVDYALWGELCGFKKEINEHREEERKRDEKEGIERLRIAMSQLPPRLRKVMMMRLQGCTLQRIGDLLGVTKERVRQLEVKAKGLLWEIIGEWR